MFGQQVSTRGIRKYLRLGYFCSDNQWEESVEMDGYDAIYAKNEASNTFYIVEFMFIY